MDCSNTISVSSFRKKLLILPIIPAVVFLMGAALMEKPVENLESISGKWKGGGISATGYRFEVEYLFRKDGSYDAWSGGKGHSRKSELPPGTVRINGGKLEYNNERGASRTGVLYEDAKGRRQLKFDGEEGGKWEVRPAD